MNDKEFETQRKRIEPVLSKWIKVLGMDFHYIQVSWERNKDDDRKHTMACTQADWQYRQMYLYFFLPKIADLPDHQIDNLVLHELAHMIVRSAYTVEEYSEKVEYAVENVARAIEDAYKAGQKAGRKERDGKVAQEQKPASPVATQPSNS